MTREKVCEDFRIYIDQRNDEVVFEFSDGTTKRAKSGKYLSNTGHWTKMFSTDTSDIYCQCSKCGFIHKFIDGHTAQYNYCPNCGARMESGT